MSAPGPLRVEVDQALPMPLHGTYACDPGELLALVGPSGAGKTSMLRVIAGLMRPVAGRVEAGGEVWCDTAAGLFRPPQARRVGLVFQHYALMPHLSAIDNVGLALLHLAPRERRSVARRWLHDLQLSDEQASRRPDALSGGQQQRVALARALAREPAALLLDEPFSAVDQMSRQALYQLLADLRRDLQVPTVLVTHDLAEARLLADRLVVIDAGRVLQQGTPGAIHRAPRNARVADLVGIRNRFDGVWLGPADEPGWGWLRWSARDGRDAVRLKVRDKGRLPEGQRVTWLIPSEGIALLEAPRSQGTPHGDTAVAAPTGDAAIAGPRGDAEFAARVSEVRHLGEMTLATLELAELPFDVFRLTIAGADGRRIAVGDSRTLALDRAAVHVMPVRASAAAAAAPLPA